MNKKHIKIFLYSSFSIGILYTIWAIILRIAIVYFTITCYYQKEDIDNIKHEFNNAGVKYYSSKLFRGTVFIWPHSQDSIADPICEKTSKNTAEILPIGRHSGICDPHLKKLLIKAFIENDIEFDSCYFRGTYFYRWSSKDSIKANQIADSVIMY